MNKVGRPVKYTDDNERIETRRNQNRENQRRCRKRKKILEELRLFSTTPINRNKEYRTNLVDFFKQFDFNYLFTGTIDLNYIEKEKHNEVNQEIKNLNQTLETELSYQVERKIGIKSLRKYTDRYIQYLSDHKLFERCFVVFEVGKYRKPHIHILFGSNSNVIDFNKTLNNKWLLGHSKTEPISTENDKLNVLKYCTKELNPSSNKINDLNKIDNWFVSGDFKKDITKVNTTTYSTINTY